MNILNNIIEVNGDLGFSVQGTANCKALGFARNIAQAQTFSIIARLPQVLITHGVVCLLYTSPSPRDGLLSRMPSSA